MRLAYFVLAAGMAFASDGARLRIFLVGSQSVQLAGDATLGETEGSLQLAGANSTEDVEVMRTFMKFCPQVTITTNRDKADYILRVQHEEVNPGTPFTRGNKIAVFNKDEDLIYTGSARLLSNAVKDTCRALATR